MFNLSPRVRSFWRSSVLKLKAAAGKEICITKVLNTEHYFTHFLFSSASIVCFEYVCYRFNTQCGHVVNLWFDQNKTV